MVHKDITNYLIIIREHKMLKKILQSGFLNRIFLLLAIFAFSGALTLSQAQSGPDFDIEDPTNIILSNSTVAENTVANEFVGVLSTADPDFEGGGSSYTYTYTLGSSNDEGYFYITNNNLFTSGTPLNYEARASHTYTIFITSTSSETGSVPHTKEFTITVTDVNEAPDAMSLSSSSTPENGGVVTVGGLTSNDEDADGAFPDGDTKTYSKVSGSASLNVSGTNVVTTGSLDAEGGGPYNITVRVTDSGSLTYEKQFTITATNVNEGASDIALTSMSIAEGAGANATVGTLSNNDPDSGTDAYTLVAGTGDTDNALFDITGPAGSLAKGNSEPWSLVAKASLDYEDAGHPAHTFAIRVQHSDGSITYQEQFTINVTDNAAPSTVRIDNSTSDSFPENSGVNFVVGTLSASIDGSDNSIASFTEAATGNNADNDKFNISGTSLRVDADWDFETGDAINRPFQVAVTVTDTEGKTATQNLLITLSNVNEAPTGITWAAGDNDIDENNLANAVVGTLVATDVDASDSWSYDLVPGSGDGDNDKVSIVGANVSLVGASDHETDDTYDIRVRTTDGGNLTFDQQLTIDIIDVNDAPTAVKIDGASSDSIPENSGTNFIVGTLTASDQDPTDTHTYALVTDGSADDDDNGSFTIAGTGPYTLQTSADFDFENQAMNNPLRVLVRVTDNHAANALGKTSAGGLTYEQALTITITDVSPEAPTDITLTGSSVEENAGTNASVGTFTVTDPDDGQTGHTWALVNVPVVSALGKVTTPPSADDDDDNGLFTLNSTTGVLTANSSFDLETLDHNPLRIYVRVTDPSPSSSLGKTEGGALTYEEAFTITVTNANEGPVLAGTAGSITYTEGNSATVITSGLTISDVDAGDNLSSATIQIASNYVEGSDELSYPTTAALGKVNANTDVSLTPSWNASTGTLTITGEASTAAYQTALADVRYEMINDYQDPSKSTKTVSYQVNDEASAYRLSKADGTEIASNSLSATVYLVQTDQTPYIDNVESTVDEVLSYPDNSGAVNITSTLTVWNDNPQLSGATVSFSGGVAAALAKTETPVSAVYEPTEDALEFTAQNGITGSFSSGTGELVLTGTATNEQYQAALRAVKYINSSQSPTVGVRLITFEVDDYSSPGKSLFKTEVAYNTRAIEVVDRANVPVVVKNEGLTVAKSATGIINETVLDANDPDASNGNGSLTYSVSGPSHGSLMIGGQSVSSFTQNQVANGLLSYKHDGTETATDSFTFSVTDGEYTTASQTFEITITGVNSAPVLANIETVPVEYTIDATPVSLTATLTVTDSNDTNLQSATVSITSGFVPTTSVASPGDGLFTSGLPTTLAATFSASTGVLAITGEAPVADYETALRGVGFSTAASGASSAVTRTVSFEVSDGVVSSNVETIDVNITENTTLTAPSAPVLTFDSNGNPVLTWTVGTGATGIQVWRLVITTQRNAGTLYKSTGTETYELVATLAGDATTYTDTNAEEGVAYEYAVTAFDATGSTAIPPSSGDTPPVSPLRTPSDLTAVAGEGSIELSWTDNSSAEDSYSVERSTDGTTWSVAGSSNSDSFTDTGLADGTYSYRVMAVDATIPSSAYSNVASATVTTEVTGFESLSGTPVEYALHQNYPNPFNPSTNIRFALPSAANVHVAVYNLIGQEIAELVSGQLSAGYHEVEWDASNVNSGIYFYKIQAGDFTEIKKMILMK